jgi:uncharacterized protein (TIGR02246 family)
MVRLTLPLCLLSLAVAVSSAQAPTPSSMPAGRGDDEAIKALVASYHAARDVSDPAAIRSLFVADADQLVSTGEWRHGREALVQGMLSSSKSRPGRRTLAVETIRALSKDLAIADARYEIAEYANGETRKMWSTFVVQRTPDGWRIAAIRNMLPAR